MELTKRQINMTKGIAILFMLFLHLFCAKVSEGLYTPIIFIRAVPLVYYLALFCDCCVVIYCFCSGYGLMLGYKKNKDNYLKKNLIRIRNLYINYWIIIFLFVLLLGFILGRSSEFPGSLKDLLMTITAIDPKYNGAWWFVTTYILLVFASSVINKLVVKKNNYSIVGISFIVYCIAYIQRIKMPVVFNIYAVDLVIKQLTLFGIAQLPFIIGVIFADKKLYSKLNNRFSKIKFKNTICILIIIAMIIAHGIVQTLFVAIFTGIVFICLFNLIDKPAWINNLFNYLGNHSTNIWLTHMFFYMIYFKNLIYAPRYSFLIFIWLVILCLVSSYLIKFIYKFINKFVMKDVQPLLECEKNESIF